MKTKKPVTIYVGNSERAEQFVANSNWVVFPVSDLHDALAQTIFSYPDAIIIDAAWESMLVAEDTYFHLRTINHPPIIVLSDVPGRWDVAGTRPVTVLPNATPQAEVMQHVQNLITGEAVAVR